jgi:hypothetical protein
VVDEEIGIDARDKTGVRGGAVGQKKRAAEFGSFDVGNRGDGHHLPRTGFHKTEWDLWEIKVC